LPNRHWRRCSCSVFKPGRALEMRLVDRVPAGYSWRHAKTHSPISPSSSPPRSCMTPPGRPSRRDRDARPGRHHRAAQGAERQGHLAVGEPEAHAFPAARWRRRRSPYAGLPGVTRQWNAHFRGPLVRKWRSHYALREQEIMQDRCKSAVQRLMFGRNGRPDDYARISRRMPRATRCLSFQTGQRLFRL
jgi:hypothetical protein